MDKFNSVPPGIVSIGILVCLLGACESRPRSDSTTGLPSVLVRPAAPAYFRGANSPSPSQPGETDCNSPAHWDGDTLYVFNSAGHPWRSSGKDIFHLDGDYRRCDYNNKVNGGRWIECTIPSRSGPDHQPSTIKHQPLPLYGWYHLEPTGICPGTRPDPKMNLTAPRIGAVKSVDNGATWEDLGIVLDAPAQLRCGTKNFYFAGGNGDFSAMLDPRAEYVYFFFSTYVGEVTEQGVGVARMRGSDRDQPADRVWKWYNGEWREPGLGGRVTPVFKAYIDWHAADANAFWGPSIHWNTYLRQYVILLNRSKDAHWAQEGIYVSFNPDLSNPAGWSEPVKILDATGPDRWYPQVIGTNKGKHETDKLAGQTARLFVRGESLWELTFLRPREQR